LEVVTTGEGGHSPPAQKRAKRTKLLSGQRTDASPAPENRYDPIQRTAEFSSGLHMGPGFSRRVCGDSMKLQI